ncbi:MAG: GntG family PLP-dependent aldolase [Acidobacteriota bacterium]
MSIQIDLRSDTVTRPSPAMLEAMTSAEVGDDVFREDPTVRRLEQRAAELVGHEDSTFVPSGTMGNQIALHLHGRPGGEVICERRSHIVLYEMGAMATISGLQPRTADGVDGVLAVADLEPLVALDVPYRSRSALLALENSHNMAGGRLLPPQRQEELVAFARRHGLPVHLDGARVFNAAAGLGVPVDRLTATVDSVMFCLSKGLGAPVGSLLCGSADFIHEARRVRKMLGGGLRQVGILAAAGLVALEEGPRHLLQDHQNARYLADELAQTPGIEIDPQTVETNIVIFGITAEQWSGQPAGENPAGRLGQDLAEQGVGSVPVSRHELRWVTHRDVSREQLRGAVTTLRRILGT